MSLLASALWVQPGFKKPLFKHKHSLKRKIPGHQHLNGDDLLYHIHRLETREVEWGIEGGGLGSGREHWTKRWKERKPLEKRRMGWEPMSVLIRVNSVVELWWSQIFLKLPNPKPTERGAGPHVLASGGKSKATTLENNTCHPSTLLSVSWDQAEGSSF